VEDIEQLSPLDIGMLGNKRSDALPMSIKDALPDAWGLGVLASRRKSSAPVSLLTERVGIR